MSTLDLDLDTLQKLHDALFGPSQDIGIIIDGRHSTFLDAMKDTLPLLLQRIRDLEAANAALEQSYREAMEQECRHERTGEFISAASWQQRAEKAESQVAALVAALHVVGVLRNLSSAAAEHDKRVRREALEAVDLGALEEKLKRRQVRCPHAEHGQKLCVGCAASAVREHIRALADSETRK